MSVLRRRLLDLLAEPASSSVVILVAPPGYGKTVLLQHFASEEKLIYINLSSAKTREALVRDIVGAVAPRLSRSLGTLLGQAANTGFHTILTQWVLVRLRSIETTIVLDDLQHIANDSSAMQLLSSLIEGTRSHIRWILASRQMPMLPIGTWIAHSITTLPINERDLAFTIGEASEIAMGKLISIADLQQIVSQNAGWPIGVRIAIDAWHRYHETQPLLDQTRGVLFAYLQTELWKNLKRSNRELIVACALLPRVTTEVLIEAGFRRAAPMLADIERTLPFVTRNPDGTYSVHELFRDFALDDARRQSDFLPRILIRIRGALLRRDRYPESLSIAMLSGLPAEILSTLGVGGIQMIESGSRGIVEAAIESLPAVDRDHVICRALRGIMAHSDGSAKNAEAMFMSALAVPSLPPAMMFEVSRRLAVMAYNRGDGAAAVQLLETLLDSDVISLSERIVARSTLAAALAIAGRSDEARTVIALLQAELSIFSAEVHASVLDRIGLALYYTGDHLEAREAALQASSLANDVGRDRIAWSSYGVLFSIASMNDTDAQHLKFYAREQAIAGERAGDRSMQTYGLQNQLIAAAESGDKIGAANVVTLLDSLGETNVYRSIFAVRLACAVLEAASGDIERAISMLLGVTESNLNAAEIASRSAHLALFDLLAGNPDDASTRITPALLVEVNRDFHSKRDFAIAQVLRSLALWTLNRRVTSERSLSQQKANLGPRDRILADAIAEITRQPHPLPDPKLAQAPCDRIEAAGLGAYATLLMRVATFHRVEVILTGAEIKTLRTFYALNGSAAEVATALDKSVFTVTNQVKSAINKIGCSSRNEAIAYARNAGWIT